MPLVPLIWIGGGAALLYLGERLVDQAGDTAEQTGNASLKLAGAAAVLVGAWYLWGRA